MRPFLFLVLLTSPAIAQKPPKIDSLLIRLAKPKAEVMDIVVGAFATAGLQITDQTSSLVTASLGTTDNLLADIRYSRTVRALLLVRESTTMVLITGDEIRIDKQDGQELQRLRIDNRAGGDGGKAWRKMVAAAMAIDSTQVPPAAITAKQ